jgi:hypothetical protein
MSEKEKENERDKERESVQELDKDVKRGTSRILELHWAGLSIITYETTDGINGRSVIQQHSIRISRCVQGSKWQIILPDHRLCRL